MSDKVVPLALRPACLLLLLCCSPPAAVQADLNTCSPKCSALPSQRITKVGHLAVVVKPGAKPSCPMASWYPPDWQPDIESGSLLLSGPQQEGGHVGNGYVGAWIKSLVGSQGPVQPGYEHVVGVFAGRNTNSFTHFLFIYFSMVMLPLNSPQSSDAMALLHFLLNTSLPSAVSTQRSVGTPKSRVRRS
jgi:hypothetical protein